MTDIELIFARTFNMPAGKKVIEHLRSITIERFLGANATEAELRALEGQRALVHQIEILARRGKGES
jgi:hypothetical protein